MQKKEKCTARTVLAEYPTFRTLFPPLPPQIIVHGLFVRASIGGNPACYPDPPFISQSGPRGRKFQKVPFPLFPFCPRHLGVLLVKAWWTTLHAPFPPNTHHLSMLSLESLLRGQKSSSLCLFLDLSLPSLHVILELFWLEIFEASLSHAALHRYTRPYFRPIPEMVALQRNPALTFSLNSEPHYFSFLSRLADLEAARRGRPQWAKTGKRARWSTTPSSCSFCWTPWSPPKAREQIGQRGLRGGQSPGCL